jgi:hypothetical protein
MKVTVSLFFAFLLSLSFAFSQKPYQDGYRPKGQQAYRHAPLQMSLITPIGTNGLKSARTINHLSFNLIAGVSAGTQGVEFGGFANVNRSHMYGAQFAGFGNIVGGNTIGAQFAGFGNIVGGNSHALQFAGFGNIVGGDVSSAQFAGFGNIAGGKVGGGQVAGFGNVAKKVNGLQLAGFGNVAEHVNGAQVSGFINVAKQVNGLQLGVVNIADEMNGIPVGLVSVVKKNGYRKLEASTSGALNAQLALKMGVEHFYNIFAVGGQFSPNQNYYAVGYGIGTQWQPLQNGLIANVELMTWHVNDGISGWMRDLNLLNQAKLSVGIPLFNAITLFAGPTYNIMVSDAETAIDLTQEAYLPIYALGNELSRNGNTRVRQWVGLHAGVRF